jgi:hypothetical protein
VVVLRPFDTSLLEVTTRSPISCEDISRLLGPTHYTPHAIQVLAVSLHMVKCQTRIGVKPLASDTTTHHPSPLEMTRDSQDLKVTSRIETHKKHLYSSLGLCARPCRGMNWISPPHRCGLCVCVCVCVCVYVCVCARASIPTVFLTSLIQDRRIVQTGSLCTRHCVKTPLGHHCPRGAEVSAKPPT